jgi:hypothetical protein
MNEPIPYVEQLRAELVRAIASRPARRPLRRRRRMLIEPRGPRSPLRRGALIAAGAACAAVAALAAIDLLDSDTPGPAVVDSAVAAVTRPDVVYHVVELATGRESPPRDGAQEGPQELLIESWYTSDGRMHRKGFAVRDGQRGRLMEDFAGRRPPGRALGSALRWDALTNTISESGFGGRIAGGAPYLDSFADPGAQLRALQQEGRLRLAGTTEVGGKRAYRLVTDRIPVGEDQGLEIEFMVDAETYLPLSQRGSLDLGEGRTLEVLTRYRVYERLPLNDQTSRLLPLDPHPGAKCSPFDFMGRKVAAHERLEERDLGFPNPCRPAD